MIYDFVLTYCPYYVLLYADEKSSKLKRKCPVDSLPLRPTKVQAVANGVASKQHIDRLQ